MGKVCNGPLYAGQRAGHAAADLAAATLRETERQAAAHHAQTQAGSRPQGANQKHWDLPGCDHQRAV